MEEKGFLLYLNNKVISTLDDKEYFEKPKYINWNEITINCNNKKEKILVVNKLKKNIVKSKHN